MANSVQKVNKKRVIMALLSLVLINTGCEDRIDSSGVSGEKMVEVSLNIGIADEADGYDLSVAPASKAGSPKNSAFDMQLTPTAATRAVSAKPDMLYRLEIRQYNYEGNHLAGTDTPTNKTIGETFTANLQEATGCQLVFVAWGQNSSSSLGTGNLSSAQAVSIESSTIKDIQPGNMNTMPYVLHLKNVNVTNDGKITSPEGKDVRVLLKRLAARLTLTWNYNVSGYKLNQILLQSIPLDYKVVAAPDEKENNTYPSLLDQYTTIQLTDNEIAAGSYSCWIPANVRGTNSFASSPLYRIKSNAPTGSAYASFIAVNNDDYKKKLDYRVYLGGNDYSDFNLYSNTDYSYTVNFNHTGLPVNDRRVTIIDPIPASESNNNIVPTANCFMVAPGGAFCFDPFVFQQSGTSIENSTLKGWSDKEGGIAYVKLIWQTKENGDVGDPVMGVVNSADDHTNIVDIKKNSGDEVSKESPVTAKGQARIYCRVAPNTTGGSGLIAAYNASNQIIWSWHVWVTDYAPDANEDKTVNVENKRVQKYTYGGKEQYPMMDRNLGALAGYTNVPEGDLAKSKANGFHYQCGRKDPFPSTYSSSIGVDLNINTDKPTPGMLNYYQPDGFSYYVRGSDKNSVYLRETFKNPTTTYSANERWCVESTVNLWEEQYNKKSVYDPCPSGWLVASKLNYRPLFTSTSYEHSNWGDSENMNIGNPTSLQRDGGAVVYFEENNSGNSTYIRLTGYQELSNKFTHIGEMANLWCRESGTSSTFAYAFSISIGNSENIYNISEWRPRDAHPVRCIQDRSK